MAKEILKQIARPVIRRLPGRRVRWGTLRRTRPFSEHFGWDRGKPVDRAYIEGFLARNQHLIKGDVLEVRRPDYTRRFGNGEVERTHVVDIDASNKQATLIADLGETDSLPADSYDAIVFTQTLHFIPDDRAAVQNLWRALRPGGSLLITVPSTIRLDNEIPESDYWRYTPLGLEQLLRGVVEAEGDIEVEGHGNVLTAIAFITGIAREELSQREIAVSDPNFPIVACARVTKKPQLRDRFAALGVPAMSLLDWGIGELALVAG